MPPVSPDSFDPAELGAEPEPPRPLDKLLVTGDSLAMPLDVEMARRLADAGDGGEVERDPHVGTGISKTGLVDWGKLSTEHVAEREPDAVVVFIGANEGFADARAGRRGARVLRRRTGRRSTPTACGA